VIWGREWDVLLAKDRDGLLVKRMGEIVDGQYQKYAVESGAYVREHFWGADPRLLEMVKHLSDDQLKKMSLGGHDPVKVYNAYKAAVENKGAPTVVLARTIKGYGLGEAGEGKNITHQQKKMNEEELRAFRTRFGIPISDTEISKTPFYRPPTTASKSATCGSGARGSAATCHQEDPQRDAQDGADRTVRGVRHGTDGRKASTTMVFVRLLSKLLRDKEIGHLVVPIVPDEARTFGMEAYSGRSVSTPTPGRSTSRSIWTRSFITRKRPTARFSRKGSTRPGRCRRSSPPVPPTPPTASTPFPSSSSIRCSDSSELAT
jgi:pyruvate dehydrogenase E1 component